MYHSFFGIDEQAFSIAVNPRYLYMSSQHREALAHLMYGVKSGGFVMLTGEVGTGKTTIIRCLLEQLPDETDVAMVLNPAANAGDLLCSICDEFGVPYAADETNLKALNDKLLGFLLKNHEKGRKSIVLVDEAQLLKVSTLEQVRLLTNLESNTEKLLQIILVGQPELNDLLARPALRQLSQRITARYHLRPLNNKETSSYIRHRLAVAGLAKGRQLFPPKVIAKIYDISGGIPRLINILCDRMLLGAYSREKLEVDLDIVKQASNEVLHNGKNHSQKRFDFNSIVSPTNIAIASAAIAISCVVALIWVTIELRETRQMPIAVKEPLPAESLVKLPAEVAEIEVVEITEPKPEKKSEPLVFWQASKDKALSELLAATTGSLREPGYPCWTVSKMGMKCETLNAETWTDLVTNNRPAVLHLNTPSRFAAYTTFMGYSGDQALLLVDGESMQVSLEKLGALWTGEYTFVWRVPPKFDKPIGMGSQGDTVAWLAQRFAELDGQSEPLAQNTFTKSLATRVKMFQRENRLKEDGVVGMQTLLRLNDALGIDSTLANVSDESQRATGGL